MGQAVTVEYRGRRYSWDGRGWYDAATYEVATENLKVLLTTLLPPEARPPAKPAPGRRKKA